MTRTDWKSKRTQLLARLNRACLNQVLPAIAVYALGAAAICWMVARAEMHLTHNNLAQIGLYALGLAALHAWMKTSTEIGGKLRPVILRR